MTSGAGITRRTERFLKPRRQTKNAYYGASYLRSGRRPTDLCATALFSFQGTDAAAKPITDRITDRTVGAKRQSQRELIYHSLQAKSSLSA